MTWPEIYNKRKDTELMKELAQFVYKEFGYAKDKSIFFLGGKGMNIKDIWGYLICFAETKGIELILIKLIGINVNAELGQCNKTDITSYYANENNIEPAMLWCAEKFFEKGK